MLRQWQGKSLVKAKIDGKWRYITEFEQVADRALRVKIQGQSILVPHGHWKAVTTDPAQGASDPAPSQAAHVDLTQLKPGAPLPRRRLKRDRVPAEHVVLAFVVVGAVLLGGLIVAALMTRL